MTRHGTIVAYLALFVALSGTAIAAAPLISGKDVRNGSLTGKDINEAKLHPDMQTRDVSARLTENEFGYASGFAYCDASEQVISGGYAASGQVRESHAAAGILPGENDAWFVMADLVPGTTKQGVVIATCSPRP